MNVAYTSIGYFIERGLDVSTSGALFVSDSSNAAIYKVVWIWRSTLSIVQSIGPIRRCESGRWWITGGRSGTTTPQICCKWLESYTLRRRLIHKYSSSGKVPA